MIDCRILHLKSGAVSVQLLMHNWSCLDFETPRLTPVLP